MTTLPAAICGHPIWVNADSANIPSTERPNMHVRAYWADSQGADDMNLKLSQARVETVLTSLIARGVAAEALAARSYGETQPIADNATVEGRSANRRITFDWLDSVEQADG